MPRGNYYNLIERNQDAVEEMLAIAKQSEHPRAFEVVGQLIKAGLDANKELMSLHKTKKELSIEKGGDKVSVNNAVFVGSTAELQKLLKGKKVINMAYEKSPFYLSNPNLKSVGQNVEWTEDTLQEYVKV